jgi:hypothetical protein
MWQVEKMKRLSILKHQSQNIQLEIRRLLLESYSYNNGLSKQLDVISTVSELRHKLAVVQRELRERILSA